MPSPSGAVSLEPSATGPTIAQPRAGCGLTGAIWSHRFEGMPGTRIGFALLVVALAAGVARADLASGRDKYTAGDYKAAKAELEKVSGKDRPAARVLLARAQMATGDYAAAEATLAPLAQGKDAPAAEARLALAELRQLTGRIADARRDLEQLYRDRPDDRAVRTALGLVRLAQGEPLKAKDLFDLTIKESDTGKLDLDNPV